MRREIVGVMTREKKYCSRRLRFLSHLRKFCLPMSVILLGRYPETPQSRDISNEAGVRQSCAFTSSPLCNYSHGNGTFNQVAIVHMLENNVVANVVIFKVVQPKPPFGLLQALPWVQRLCACMRLTIVNPTGVSSRFHAFPSYSMEDVAASAYAPPSLFILVSSSYDTYFVGDYRAFLLPLCYHPSSSLAVGRSMARLSRSSPQASHSLHEPSPVLVILF